jgi:hypothetical protein
MFDIKPAMLYMAQVWPTHKATLPNLLTQTFFIIQRIEWRYLHEHGEVQPTHIHMPAQ